MNLIVFATTMGHGGRHTYKHTIQSILDATGNFFRDRYLHLKVRPEEEHIVKEIADFCHRKYFRVLVSNAPLVHHSQNHAHHSSEYFKDIYKIYSHPTVRLSKYSFWLEDDWIIESKVNIVELLTSAKDFLDSNPNQICVRFNPAESFYIESKDNFPNNQYISTQGLRYTHYGPTFTFQPNINRTNEIYAAWKSVQKNLDRLGSIHCELLSGEILKQFTESPTPFSFFNPELAYARHIG